MAEPSIRLGEGFTCGEVRGGNGVTHTLVDLPGLHGVLYSRPCDAVSYTHLTLPTSDLV